MSYAMKQSTKWWITVLTMLLVGAVVAQVGVVPRIAYRATPLGLVTAATALLGTIVAFAIVPLVVAAITRFHRPWVVLALYVLCAGLAVVAIHNNAVHRDAATAAQQSVASVPRVVGGDNPSGTMSQPSQIQVADREAEEAAFIHAHPDILYGQNAEIMAQNMRALQGTRLNYTGMLRTAYGVAKLDGRWQLQP